MSDEIKIPGPLPPLPVGTHVNYYGSKRYYHGQYEITATVDAAGLAASGRSIDDYFLDHTGYELWPLGVPRKFGNSEQSLSYVRRGSIAPIEKKLDPPVTVKKGDTIKLIPDSGPEYVMKVAHVEHHIITLCDVIREADSGA